MRDLGAREFSHPENKEILIIAEWRTFGDGTRGTMVGVALRAVPTHLRD